MKKLVLAAPIVVLCVVACGSGGTGGDPAPGDASAPTAASTEKAVCDAQTSRAQCSDGGGATCEEGTKCYGRLMDSAAVAAWAACHGAPACKGGGDDTCFREAGENVGGQAARDYIARCRAKMQECGLLPDDECTAVVYAFRGIGASSTACLAKPCAEQKSCLETALAPVSVCKDR